MKITQLIIDLQRVLENDGDLKVVVQDEDGLKNYDATLHVSQKPKVLIIAA